MGVVRVMDRAATHLHVNFDSKFAFPYLSWHSTLMWDVSILSRGWEAMRSAISSSVNWFLIIADRLVSLGVQYQSLAGPLSVEQTT